MGQQVYSTNAVTVTVDGNPVTGYLVNYTNRVGARPAEAVVLVADKRPKDAAATSYRGKAATVAVDATTILTGSVYRTSKRLSDQTVIITILDNRWLINKTYVGASHLETLDTDGLPTSFANSLPGYGADVVFNASGKPNKDKNSLAFVPLGYEHSTAYADYWTYGQAIEYIWTNYITDVSMPTVSGQNPSAWTFGGMNRKMEDVPLFGVPIAEALDAIFARTRCQWYVDSTGAGQAFSIDQPTATLALAIRDPDSPTAPSADVLTTPEELIVEESVDDSIGQLDVIGGKQQREVLLGTTYAGGLDGIYTGSEGAVTSTDFEQDQWFGISNNAGWLAYQDYPLSPFTANWSNYNTERYSRIYDFSAGGQATVEHLYRYNLKADIYEAHKIGKNIGQNDQPYRMLSQILVARAKDGNYINPDEETAIEGVSPLELLAYQYPDGATIDLDRGYILARGVEPLTVSPLFMVEPPYWGTSLPNNFTVAFECGYRAYKSVTTGVVGLSAQVRRCVVRDELIHKTREATKTVMPVVAEIDAVGGVSIIDGITVPYGATKDYANNGTIPLKPRDLTITLPSGVVVDGMAELDEIKNVVSDYVGITMVNGRGAFPSWKNIALGTKLTDAGGTYDLTGLEVVTAVSFSDDDQKTEFAFTNRLGTDVTALATAFVDQRSYRRPL